MTDESFYAIALSRLKGLGLQNALTLYREVGSAKDVFMGLAELKGKAPVWHSRIQKILEEGSPTALKAAEEETAFCKKHGIEILDIGSEGYPFRLKQCKDAPLVLYYKGNADLNTVHVVTVVGTRRCTEYGKDLCHSFTSDLARLCPDTLVVSGLAYGIDIHAHRGALSAGLPTVAILAHGLDRIYPYAHRETAKLMVEHGGLLTEFPIGTNPDKGNFVRRNRIAAGMCDACVVVESGSKGGSLITANQTMSYDRQVFAFPGRSTDEASQGCHALIRKNTAGLITCAEDMVCDMDWITQQQRAEALQKPSQPELFPHLTDDEQTLVGLLQGSEGLQINQAVLKTGLPVGKVASLFLELEIKGIIKCMPGYIYRLIQ